MSGIEEVIKGVNELENSTVSLLRDTLDDYKKINKRKNITIWLLISLMFATFVFSFIIYQNKPIYEVFGEIKFNTASFGDQNQEQEAEEAKNIKQSNKQNFENSTDGNSK